MENLNIRESIYDDIPLLLELLYELERPKPQNENCLLYTSPSPRDQRGSRMPSSA